MPAHFKAVLFDLDGTLVDSAPDLVAAVNSLRRDLGLPEIIYEALRGRAGHGIRGLVWSALRIRKEDPPFAGLSDAFLTHYEAHIHDGTHPFAGVEAMLTALTRRGIAWGIVTNKPERDLRGPLRDRLGHGRENETGSGFPHFGHENAGGYVVRSFVRRRRCARHTCRTQRRLPRSRRPLGLHSRQHPAG